MNPLRAAFETLVAGRDRLAVAIEALAPLLELGSVPDSPAGEISAQPMKALPPPAKEPTPRRGKKMKRPKKAVRQAAQQVERAKGKRTTRKIDAAIVAKIAQLSAEGIGPGKIAAKLGVSYPTVKKYAKPATAGNGTAPAPASTPGKKVWI